MPLAAGYCGGDRRTDITRLNHCIREIEKYQTAIGMSHLVCWMQYSEIDSKNTEKSMRLFAMEVMPRFKQ